MKVLVTGGAGYIGSHTVRQLVKTGADVTVLDNMVYGHAGALVDPEVKLVKGDLGDASVVYPLLMKGNFDAVIHFAAFINVGESVQNPLKYYMNNIARPLVLLGAMQAAGVKRFVFSSTCATYGVPTQIPIPETEKQDPINPYGSSKYMLEKVCRDCDRAWGLKSVFLRYFNASGCSEDGLIGEDHEPETHLIPNILLTLTGEKEYIEVFGTDYDTPDGTCIRDYIHVNDLADAHLKAVDYLMKGGATECFNLGTGLGLSVREILETAEKSPAKNSRPLRPAPRRRPAPPDCQSEESQGNPRLGSQVQGCRGHCGNRMEVDDWPAPRPLLMPLPAKGHPLFRPAMPSMAGLVFQISSYAPLPEPLFLPLPATAKNIQRQTVPGVLLLLPGFKKPFPFLSGKPETQPMSRQTPPSGI